MASFSSGLRRARALLPFREDRDGPVVFIIGSARSGTTWLAESIVDQTAGRYVFEPFGPKATGPLAGPDTDRLYLRADESRPDADTFLKKIVQQPFRNRWTDQTNSRFFYRARIIKAVRANMMIGRIAALFPDIRIPFVLRDPYATVRSQCSLNWPAPLEPFLAQAELMADRPEGDRARLTAAGNMFERSVVRWCLENRVALEQIAASGGENIRVFRYDTLRDDLEQFDTFQRFCGAEAPAHDGHARPSRVSQGKQSFRTTPRDDGFTPEQMAFFRDTLSYFGFAEYVGTTGA